MNKPFSSPYPVTLDCEFHHIGCAVTSVEKELAVAESLGYRKEGDNFSDPGQGISGCFVTGLGPRLELLENLPGSETLTPWLERGIRLYHFAYTTPNLEKSTALAKKERGRLVVQPVPSVAFGGNPIAFYLLYSGLLLEFIENPRR